MSSCDQFDPGQGGKCPDLTPLVIAITSLGERLAAALLKIDDTLNRKLKGACDNIDDCLDDIAKKLKDKFRTATKSCNQCKQMIAQGLGGTLEFAIACAGSCIENELSTCSKGEGDTQGKPCMGCGQEPCCCKNNVCSPCEPDVTDQWIGWCNSVSLVWVVRKQSEGSPGPEWRQVSMSPNEEMAANAAAAACSSQQPPPREPTPPFKFPDVAPFTAPFCDIGNYGSYSSVTKLVNKQVSQAGSAGLLGLIQSTIGVALGGAELGILGQAISGGITGLLSIPLQTLQVTPPLISSAVGCSDPIFNQVLANLGILATLQRFTGLDVTDFTAVHRYVLHSLCRQIQLSPDEALAAYFANVFDAKTLDTHFGIAGLCPDAVKTKVQAGRSKPVPAQLIAMRRREILSKQGYSDGMRELGYLQPEVSENLFEISEQIPSLSQLIPLMVRDAADEGLAAQFCTDDYFEDKFTGKVEEWAKWQGIPEDYARLAWRAHWQIPSPTALFEFLHRLRHSKTYPKAETIEKDVRTALIQQDILPYWIDAYIATSYRPMTRRDIQRAFEIGVLNRDEVWDGFVQIGHSDEVAETLTKYAERLKLERAQNNTAVKLWKKFAISRLEAERRLGDDGFTNDQIERILKDAEPGFSTSTYAQAFTSGLLSRGAFVAALTANGVTNEGATAIADRLSVKLRKHRAARLYASGAITRGNASGNMAIDGINPDVADNILSEIDATIKDSLLVKCQNGVKHRFMHGELDQDDARLELVSRGTVSERASQLIAEWECEKSAVGRSVPTSTLCTLLEQGSITAQDFYQRLVRIGHTELDAQLLVNNCLNAISERRMKLADKERKLYDTEAKRAARNQAIALAAIQRESDKMEATRKRAKSAMARRRQAMLSAAEKLYKACGCPLDVAITAANAARDTAIRDYGLPIDDAIAVAIKSAEALDTGDINDYSSIVEKMASESARVPTDDDEVQSSQAAN